MVPHKSSESLTECHDELKENAWPPHCQPEPLPICSQLAIDSMIEIQPPAKTQSQLNEYEYRHSLVPVLLTRGDYRQGLGLKILDLGTMS